MCQRLMPGLRFERSEAPEFALGDRARFQAYGLFLPLASGFPRPNNCGVMMKETGMGSVYSSWQ
jgi:hypothetical protein